MTAKTVLHSHNSIPCFTGYEDEGCVVCMRNKVIEEIRAAMPSEQDMLIATATVWCLPKHSKKQIDPELSKDMATAIRELIISKLQ